MRLASDRSAASPLTVIAVVVLLAVLATTLILYLTVDTQHEVLELNVVQQNGQRYLEVGRVEGDYSWNELTVSLINQAGTDRATSYLQVPTGTVAQGDRLPIEPRPPAGEYVLEIKIGEQVLTQRIVAL